MASRTLMASLSAPLVACVVLCAVAPAAPATTTTGRLGGKPLVAAVKLRGIASGLPCNVVKPAIGMSATRVPITLRPRRAPRGDAFYTPPRALPGCTHGDLIYSRRLDNPTAALVDGHNWLVMYRSEDVRGNPVATTGI